MHLIYVRKLPINQRNRHACVNGMARRVLSKVTPAFCAKSRKWPWNIADRKRERNDVDDFYIASLRNEEREQDAKTTAADLTRGEAARHRIRERNGRCATIKPECRGASTPPGDAEILVNLPLAGRKSGSRRCFRDTWWPVLIPCALAPHSARLHDGFLNARSKRGEICTIEKWTRKSGIFLPLFFFIHINE